MLTGSSTNGLFAFGMYINDHFIECFRGSSLRARINVKREGWDVFLEVITDGVQTKLEVKEGTSEIVLVEGLDPQKMHEFLLFKRMDTMNLIDEGVRMQ